MLSEETQNLMWLSDVRLKVELEQSSIPLVGSNISIPEEKFTFVVINSKLKIFL